MVPLDLVQYVSFIIDPTPLVPARVKSRKRGRTKFRLDIPKDSIENCNASTNIGDDPGK